MDLDLHTWVIKLMEMNMAMITMMTMIVLKDSPTLLIVNLVKRSWMVRSLLNIEVNGDVGMVVRDQGGVEKHF